MTNSNNSYGNFFAKRAIENNQVEVKYEDEDSVKAGENVLHGVPEPTKAQKFRILSYAVLVAIIVGFMVGFASRDTFVQDNLNEIKESKVAINTLSGQISVIEKKIEKEHKDIEKAKSNIATRGLIIN